jgi:hypothetical protein
MMIGAVPMGSVAIVSLAGGKRRCAGYKNHGTLRDHKRSSGKLSDRWHPAGFHINAEGGVRCLCEPTAELNARPARSVGIHQQSRDTAMTLSTILIIVLILALIGALPNWGYSRGWGFAPSGIIGTILIILLILALLGRV